MSRRAQGAAAQFAAGDQREGSAAAQPGVLYCNAIAMPSSAVRICAHLCASVRSTPSPHIDRYLPPSLSLSRCLSFSLSLPRFLAPERHELMCAEACPFGLGAPVFWHSEVDRKGVSFSECFKPKSVRRV